jgi:hypothetical protein
MRRSGSDRRGDVARRTLLTDATATHRRSIDGGAHPSEDALRSQDQWLDLIADLIVEDLRNEELKDADALRGVRPVQ